MQKVVLQINDVNEGPTDIALDSTVVDLPEGVPQLDDDGGLGGALVSVLTVVDEDDPAETFTWAITGADAYTRSPA